MALPTFLDGSRRYINAKMGGFTNRIRFRDVLAGRLHDNLELARTSHSNPTTAIVNNPCCSANDSGD